MTRIIIVGLGVGVLFGVLDGLIHGLPQAAHFFEVYAPIARPGINVVAGVGIDLLWGVIMAAIFVLLRPSLPGRSGLAKGLSFGLITWFFRVAMGVASSWMMYQVPVATLAYVAVSGLVEMLLIGAVLGVALRK